MQSRFKRAPGMVFDWVSMMSLKLNDRRKWLNGVTRVGHEDEDLVHIEYWMEKFEQPHGNLRLFFYLPNDTSPSCFMELFRELMQSTKGNLSEEDIWAAYEDEERMKDCIARYYFGISADQLTLPEIGSRLRDSEMAGEMQALVLGFFVDPQAFLQCLRYWTRQYHEQMLEIYKAHMNEILAWQEGVEVSDLLDVYLYFTKNSTRFIEKAYGIENAVFSQALIMKNTYIMGAEDENVWYVLGSEFRESLNVRKNPHYAIHELCNAVGDQNRQIIMEYIMSEGEKSTTEVAKRLNSSLNTAAYHLEVMRKARILSVRSRGKSNFFWINTEACRVLAQQLETWAKYANGDRLEP